MSYSATKWELTDTLVNHIVLLTHSQDKMPQRLRPLIEKYHMSFFTRYPAEILDAMVQNYEGEKEKKRIAIILVAKSDYNSALNTITQVERSIFRQHKTYIYEVGSKADFYSATRELGEECAGRGEKIGLVQFDGHGDEKVIQFGFPYTYSKTELSSSSVGFLTPLRRYLSDNAQLVLSACETAKGKEGLNIAYNFANAWKGVEVFASNAETGTRDILFDREGRVTDVKYTKGDSLVVYKL